MILSSNLHQWIVENLSFPLSQFLFNRKNIGKYFQNALKTERMSREVIESFQKNNLVNILENAKNRVPYYRDLFKRIGFHPERGFDASAFKSIPPLSRDDLIANRYKLVDERFLYSAFKADKSDRAPGEPSPFAFLKKYYILRNTSSGSTGAPTVFYEDGSISAGSWANELRLKSWFGLKPGVKEARLVRLSSDHILKNKANSLRRLLWNQILLPGINLNKKEYEFISQQLIHNRPKVIWAFTSAIAETARYMHETHKSLRGWIPELIITWAAPFYDFEREIIANVFNCKISNIYGIREVGHIAAYCPAGSLHIFQDSHFLETDANGELLVTYLRWSPMPLIRYKTGDIGEIAYEKCTCGRTMMIIKAFHGRTGEIYKTEDGRMFSPNFWCRTFMDFRLAAVVKRFQIVYLKNRAIKIRMIVPPGKRPDVESILRQVVKQNFGLNTSIIFEYPDEIAPHLSGKYQMVIDEAKNH